MAQAKPKGPQRKIYSMKLQRVPFSSVVGQSVMVIDPKLGCVAMLNIMVPQPGLDYRTVADSVTDALFNGHMSDRGVTLVLPDDIGQTKE